MILFLDDNEYRTLLTDEEREHREMITKLLNNLGEFPLGEDADDDLRVTALIADNAFNALIAARAESKRLLDEGRSLHDRLVNSVEENKRKDEMLRSLEWSGSYWDSVSGEVLSVCPECDAPHSDMGHLVDCKLDTLLQSEKGGE